MLPTSKGRTRTRVASRLDTQPVGIFLLKFGRFADCAESVCTTGWSRTNRSAASASSPQKPDLARRDIALPLHQPMRKARSLHRRSLDIHLVGIFLPNCEQFSDCPESTINIGWTPVLFICRSCLKPAKIKFRSMQLRATTASAVVFGASTYVAKTR